MNDELLFSIVLPTFNVRGYIDRCLESLQNQGSQKIEIIFVDDCGTDGSIDVVRKYAKLDSRIRVVSGVRNVGTYHARRIGVESSKGRYVLFLDPDDSLEVDAISTLESEIADKDVDLFLYGVKTLPERRWWQGKPRVPSVRSNAQDIRFAIDKIVGCKGFNFGTSGKVFNRRFLLKVYSILNVGLEERLVYGEDSLLFSAVLMSMRSAWCVRDELYIYHKNPTSITVGVDADIVKKRLDSLNKVVEILDRCSWGDGCLVDTKHVLLCRLKKSIYKERIKISRSLYESAFLYRRSLMLGFDFRELVKFLLCVVSMNRVRY